MSNFLDNKCEDCAFFKKVSLFPAWFNDDPNLEIYKNITRACTEFDDVIIIGTDKQLRTGCEEFVRKDK